MDLHLLALIAFSFTLAGLVKGLIGLGLPLTAMGVLVLVMKPVEAAAILIVPSFAANVYQAIAGPHLGTLLRRFWPLLLGGAVATLAGTGWLANGDPSLAISILGGILVFFALVTLARPGVFIPRSRTRWLNPIIGVLTGLVTATTGVSTVPIAPYLQSLDLEPGELVQALGLFFTSATVALAINLTLSQALFFGSGWEVAVALAATGFGMALGTVLRSHISPPAFRKVFLIALFALGIYLILRAALT